MRTSTLVGILLVAGLLFAPRPATAQLGKLKQKVKKAAERVERASGGSAIPEAPGVKEIPYEVEYEGTPEERQFAIEQGKRFVAVHEAHGHVFANPSADGFNFHRSGHNWPGDGPRLRQAVEEAEAVYDALLGAMRPLADRWGDSPEAIDAAYRRLNINDMDDLGITKGGDVAYRYRRVYEGLAAVAQFRKDAAADAFEHAERLMGSIEEARVTAEVRMELAQGQREVLEMAQWFDPQNEAVNERLAAFDAFMHAAAESIRREVEAGRLPAAAGPTQHTQAVLAFFRAHEAWGGKAGVEVLRVWVAGGWVVTARDLLGRPTQYGLPVYVASTKPALRELGAARIYKLTALAREASPAPQAPPFTGYWVGLDTWLVSLASFGQ